MLGIKLNRNSIRDAINKSKNIVGKAYSTTKTFLGDIDSGIKTAKQIYSIVSPTLNSLLGTQYKNLNKNVIKGLSGYENLRNKIMETDEQINNHYNNISSNLKKNKIDIGL